MVQKSRSLAILTYSWMFVYAHRRCSVKLCCRMALTQNSITHQHTLTFLIIIKASVCVHVFMGGRDVQLLVFTVDRDLYVNSEQHTTLHSWHLDLTLNVNIKLSNLNSTNTSLDLRFWQWWLWAVLSSGMWCCMVCKSPLTFRRNVMPPTSGLKRKSSMQLREQVACVKPSLGIGLRGNSDQTEARSVTNMCTVERWERFEEKRHSYFLLPSPQQ
jgi:hypothetical protein